MAQNKKPAKLNIPMCTFCVLFCLTLVTVYMTSGLYAKYTATANDGNGARVIKFGDISLSESGDFGDDGTLRIIPGVHLTKKAVVSFDGSEASTYVFVKVTPSSDFTTADNRSFAISNVNKTQMQWKIADEWSYLKTDNSGDYIYYQELAPNTPLQSDIIADNGRITVSDQITKEEISGMTGIFIRIRAFAVQNGGFSGPAAAWESIASKEG